MAEQNDKDATSGAAVAPLDANTEAPPPPKRAPNIASQDMSELAWDARDPSASLEELRKYVLANAERSESWYWKRKTNKARFATLLQWLAIWSTALAGVVPLAYELGIFRGWAAPFMKSFNAGLFASLLIGGGAALLSVDRFAGLSSGWTRYVLTATAIRAAAQDFRMDWAALLAQSAAPPTTEQSAALIQRAKMFSSTIEGLVSKETQDWATEFRQNLMMLERDLKVQIDQAKLDREKAAQDAKARAEQEKSEREKAAQPGAIEASVVNASSTDDFQFEAKLENKSAVIATQLVKGAEIWTELEIPAGQYRLTVSGLVKKRPLANSTVVTIKPGATTKLQLSLPAAPPGTATPP